MSLELHHKNALTSIAQVQTHSEYVLQLVKWLRQAGEAHMAQQIIEDFAAALARFTAAYDTEKHAADIASATQDQVAHLQAELQTAQAAVVDEQAKNAELEKALTDAIAQINAIAPAAE